MLSREHSSRQRWKLRETLQQQQQRQLGAIISAFNVPFKRQCLCLVPITVASIDCQNEWHRVTLMTSLRFESLVTKLLALSAPTVPVTTGYQCR